MSAEYVFSIEIDPVDDLETHCGAPVRRAEYASISGKTRPAKHEAFNDFQFAV